MRDAPGTLGCRPRPQLGGGLRPLWGALALAALAAGCAGGAARPSVEYETGRRAAVTADGLYRVKSWRISNAYLKPGAVFTTYRTIVIDPVSVAYQRAPRDPRGSGSPERGNFALEPWQMERFQKLFQEALDAELAESSFFEVVREPAPDALRVRGYIVDLVVNTPPERGRDRVYVSVSGEMTVILDVSDSQTREPLGRIAERREVVPAGGQLRRAGVAEWGEIERMFRSWARLLREGLDELGRLGPVPEPPPDLGAAAAGRGGAARPRASGSGAQ
jgi:hypothetical protein